MASEAQSPKFRNNPAKFHLCCNRVHININNHIHKQNNS